MTETALTPTDIKGLDLFINPCDVRRDLHVYVDYVRHRDVKRAYRSNDLSKSDSLRLAKMMTDADAPEAVKETGGSTWVDYVDWLALELGLVSYDTEGTYAGYSSREPSFPDNYIRFNAQRYRQFLGASLAEREHLILKTLVEHAGNSDNEFFQPSIFGRLDRFSTRGCAVGVVPSLKFAQARRFLLDLLAGCQCGVWYSTASLIEYLKACHRFFLIPQKPKVKDRWWKGNRYSNFHESKSHWGHDIDISAGDPDAFERVEGRYVERFLEGIPLVLRYLDVAYGKKENKGLFPSIGELKAFRVNEPFLRLMEGNLPAPKVTLQPDFRIHIESEFYPANVMFQLTPLAKVVSEDTSIILQLQKEMVAAQLINDEHLDVISLLKRMTCRELPQNTVMELEEWAGHSEIFTLYEGFGLFEGDETLSIADEFTVERISPTIRLIRSPDELFARLEEAERIPLGITHAEASLRIMPEKARTAFVKASQVRAKPKKKRQVMLQREISVRLHFPADDVLNTFRQKLLDAKCMFEWDQANRMITFSKSQEPRVKETIKALRKDYLIHIEDIQ